MFEKEINIYKNNNFEITLSKKIEKNLLNIYNEKNNYLKNKKINKKYNPLIDLFCPTTNQNTKKELKDFLENKFKKKYFLTKSKNLKNVENGKNKKTFTIVRQKDGKIIRRYWVKKFKNKEIVVKEHTEARWYKKIYDLKSRELNDAKKIRAIGIKTPTFVARIRIPKKGVIISAYEKTNFIPITNLIKKISNKEKQLLIKDVKKMGIKLINVDAMPSIFRSNEILVSKAKKREFMLTDTATGMYPISRNKLFLLEELNNNKKIIFPNWKKIENNPKEFLKYWNKLSKETRYKIQLRLLNSVIDEIKTGEKKDINDIRIRLNSLINKLF